MSVEETMSDIQYPYQEHPQIAQNAKNDAERAVDDAISRQAAIRALINVMTPMKEGDTITVTIMSNDVIRDTLNKLPSVQPQRWIPVTERLPENRRETYWVCTDTEAQCECRWTNNRFGIAETDEWGWSIFDYPQYSKVVAWMTLPEPYKGGQDDEIERS